MSYDAPFAGLKVVDLSQGIAGPYCAMLLAQHGAEVIKVEGIGEGDWARTLGTRYGSHSAFSIVGNLGKRARANWRARPKRVVWRLLRRRCFLEGSAGRDQAALGFPTLIDAARRRFSISISGFADWAAQRTAGDGSLLQAYRFDGQIAVRTASPSRAGIVVDMSTALYAFQALSAALYARRDQPRGRYIDVSLMQAATALQSIRLMASHLDGGTIRASGVFQTADGWMTIATVTDRDWRSLCEAMGRPELAEDLRFATLAARSANVAAFYAVLQPVIAAEPWAVWNQRLTKARLMHERVNSYADFLEQPQVRETGLIQWLSQAGLNRAVPVPALPARRARRRHAARTAPATGEHTASVLAEHGYSAAEIDKLMAEGVVATAA
jgi:crotonobetainyl-CoA:carnitine CoA-transferase CaiB-like acyl-CoA transferase